MFVGSISCVTEMQGVRELQPLIFPCLPSLSAFALPFVSVSHYRVVSCRVMVRFSIEISALESERRKLRSKVEMFQRQVNYVPSKDLVAMQLR